MTSSVSLSAVEAAAPSNGLFPALSHDPRPALPGRASCVSLTLLLSQKVALLVIRPHATNDVVVAWGRMMTGPGDSSANRGWAGRGRTREVINKTDTKTETETMTETETETETRTRTETEVVRCR